MHATIRFRQQLVDDLIELFDACPDHAAFVRDQLQQRRAAKPYHYLETIETTPPADAPCPYDSPGCDERQLVRTGVEDGQLMGTR